MNRTRLVSLFFVLLFSASALMAQLGAVASLSGTLTDPTAATVSGRSVNLRRVSTDMTRTVVTSSDGTYRFADLAPGRYEISVQAEGFAEHQEGIELTVGEQAVVNLALRLAPVRGEATVTAEAAATEPTHTEVSEVIEPRRIAGLPINGRQFLDLVLLTPNVHAGRSNIANPSTPGEPKQVDLSFAGLHESTTLLLVDGANNMNRINGRSRSTPSPEAVLEFRVFNDSYDAALGPATAGVVSIVTRSGTDSLHGSLYEYLRNDAVDARNLLAPAGFDKLRQNQFGATLGGPAIGKRQFYFGNYEGQRRRESPGYSSILLNNLGAINQVKTSLGLTPEVLAGKLRQSNYDSGLLRLDGQVSQQQEAAVTYRFRQDRQTNLPSATNQLSAPSNFRDATIEDHSATLNWNTVISPRTLNQAMLQLAHRSFDFPSATYEPHLQIANTLDFGRHFNAINGFSEFRFEAGDGYTWLRGAHTWRVGGNVSVTQDNFFYDPFDPAYAVFPNLNAFLGVAPFASPFAVVFGFTMAPDGSRPNAPARFAGPASLPTFDKFVHQDNAQTNFGVYAQDQWRATRRLTVNYGIRWDVDKMPTRVFDTYYKSVQPRAGLAYGLRNGRLVLRAGGGAYQGQAYSLVYLIAQVAGQDAAFGLARLGEYAVFENTLHSPFYSNPAQATPALMQFLKTGVFPILPATNFSPAQQFVSTIRRANHGGPYSYQWNAQVDWKPSRDLSISAYYLGVHGLELPSAFGGNVAPAAFMLANGKADYAIAPTVPVARTINPLVSPLSLFFDATAQSVYHAGTLAAAWRQRKHISLTANYTYSKTIDNSSDPSLNGFPEDPYRRFLERANSKQNIPHRLVATALLQGGSRGLLRGFTTSLIAVAQSSNYYTIFAGTDVNHDGNANTDRVGTLGRETYRGDALVNFDLRVARIFRISERTRAELIAEGFNMFNTLSVTDVNTVYGSPNLTGPVPHDYHHPVAAPLASFGSIRAISPPRQLQFALRLTF